jgi:hypothetical protein
MTPEQARRLNRLIWQERLKRWGPTVLLGAVVMGAIFYLAGERIARLDPTVETHVVQGEVISTAQLYGRTGVFRVNAKLSDGHEVDATSRLPQPPYQGEQVQMRAAAHASGRTTYDIVRLLN